MTSFWVPVVAVFLAADPASVKALQEGDAHYARRAEGARGGQALTAPIEAALAAYRRALAADPASLAARSRLMRALFFRSTFCGGSPEQNKSLLEEARRTADDGLKQIEPSLRGIHGSQRIPALRAIPGSLDLHFWSAVCWGEWALRRGKLAAARTGAGTKIRDLGQTVVDLDPAYEQGGGYRILGRLHDQSPRVPFFTMWISRDKALAYLELAQAQGPDNTVNQFFLAEALLNHFPQRQEEARRLLRQCGSATPRPEYRVEDAYYAELSRQRLSALGTR